MTSDYEPLTICLGCQIAFMATQQQELCPICLYTSRRDDDTLELLKEYEKWQELYSI